LHIGIGISIKKNVKYGSAAQACSLAILLASFHVDIGRGSTGVKVIGIIREGLWRRDMIGHGLMLHWWLGCSGNMVDWGWWDRCYRCWCRRGWWDIVGRGME
jgi:hypothetical protein